MIWSKNLVIALATLGALSTNLCNAAEQKEHQESVAPIAYRVDGNLLLASGKQIIETGAEPRTLHTADGYIIALACSPTEPETFAYAFPHDSKPDQIMIKRGNDSQYAFKDEKDMKSPHGKAKDQFGKTISLRFSSGGEAILRTSHNPVQAKEKYGLRSHSIDKNGDWKPYHLGPRFDCAGFSCGKNGAYLVTPKDNLKEQYCLFIDEGVLLIQQTVQQASRAPSHKLLKQRDEGATFKNIAYSPGYLVLAGIKGTKNYLELGHTPKKWANRTDFYFLHKSTITTDPYELIELSKVKPGKRPTLIATKPEHGADLYSITRPWFSSTDKLVKTRSIETDGEVQHIDSTPTRGWFSPARTALETARTIHEIDSNTGEKIAEYDKIGKQTSWNWWRTARRTALATAATITSVAAAVLSYKWFSNSRK